MPSRSLAVWRDTSAQALDEIEAAHRAVGGIARGRRYATQQINQAYAVLLSSQFQKYCRDLHSEAADHLAASVAMPLRSIFRDQLTSNRKLDKGNPNSGNLGSDFGRFGMEFWTKVSRLDQRNKARKEQLEVLNEWRNAIAHQDFDPTKLGRRLELRLADVRRWRSACFALTDQFDYAVADYLAIILGRKPW
jgi:hypothetical protein